MLKLEENVQRVQNANGNEYLNPFSLIDKFQKQKVLHISSAVPSRD